MHFYNILTVGQFSRKLSHIHINSKCSSRIFSGCLWLAHKDYCCLRLLRSYIIALRQHFYTGDQGQSEISAEPQSSVTLDDSAVSEQVLEEQQSLQPKDSTSPVAVVPADVSLEAEQPPPQAPLRSSSCRRHPPDRFGLTGVECSIRPTSSGCSAAGFSSAASCTSTAGCSSLAGSSASLSTLNARSGRKSTKLLSPSVLPSFFSSANATARDRCVDKSSHPASSPAAPV